MLRKSRSLHICSLYSHDESKLENEVHKLKLLFISMPVPEMWDRTSNLLLLTFFHLKKRCLNSYTETYIYAFIFKEAGMWLPI